MNWRWLKYWLADHEPVFCAICLRTIFRMNVREEVTLTGRKVSLCPRCHEQYFPD
jgi:hypothetical protein